MTAAEFPSIDVEVAASSLRVRDIMTLGLVTVDANASAEEAAWAFTRRHIGGAPARDEDGNLVGMLSKSDLVDPEPKQWLRKEATVGDLMNPDVVTLYGDDPALAAVAAMARRQLHRIVVIDENNRPIGIVTPMDVVKAIDRGVRFHLDPDRP